MLKIKCKQLRLSSKGNLKRIICNGIPVLSIFALVGIVSASISVSNIDNLSFDADNYKAYAAETDSGIMPLADTSASLTIDDGKIKDMIFATNGEFAYATHKVSINATNIKSYTLTLAKTAGLTGPSTVNDAGTGVTPANMDNQWGYAWINENDDPTTATYKTLSTANNLADIAIDSNHNVNASKQLVFGAKFGSSAASGTYHAEATLSLVATPRVITNYVVNVNCNSGTNCTTPLNTTSDNETYTYTISSTAPTRSGYKFLGYNTTNSTTANADYAPGKAITLTAAAPTVTLYAVWEVSSPSVTGFGGISKMQDMTSPICNSMGIGANGQLYDERDNSVYTVAKLVDGKCWMTQNLRLTKEGLLENDHSATLNSTDSDVSSFILPDSTIANFAGTASQIYYDDNEIYGAYYSWCAATAGICGTTSSTTVTTSICPKGWSLPSDFAGLYGVYTSAAESKFSIVDGINGQWIGAANVAAGGAFFPAAGYVSNGSLSSSIGTTGRYWTTTVKTDPGVYYLSVTSNSTSNGNHYAFGYGGYSVRCVAK